MDRSTHSCRSQVSTAFQYLDLVEEGGLGYPAFDVLLGRESRFVEDMDMFKFNVV